MNFRVSQNFDSFLRLIYIYIAVLTFFFSKYFLTKKELILKYWLSGALLTSIYAWYLFISSGLDLPYIKLFGMDENPQSLNGFIRCGTFKEGNYLGLFLILSSAIALYLNRKKQAIFFAITILVTFSTTSIISFFLGLVYLGRNFFLKRKTLTVMLVVIMPLSLATFFFIKETPYYKRFIYSKLVEPSTKISPRNISKVDRVMMGRIAFKMGVDNPFFGVGPYNYGLHYDKYNDFRTYITNNNSWTIGYFSRKNKRAIANNVYFEVWAEYGILGFTLFVFMLMLTLIKAIKTKNDVITAGIISLLVSLNAFPSFIMLFIWVFLAIPFSIKSRKYEV